MQSWKTREITKIVKQVLGFLGTASAVVIVAGHSSPQDFVPDVCQKGFSWREGCYELFWVLWRAVADLWIMYEEIYFACDLSFVTPFEVRFKVLGSWRIILCYNNDLEVKCIQENMNIMFTYDMFYEKIIESLYNHEFNGYYVLTKSVTKCCDKILWWVKLNLKCVYNYKMIYNYMLLMLRCIVQSENYCDCLMCCRIWFEVELVVDITLMGCCCIVIHHMFQWLICGLCSGDKFLIHKWGSMMSVIPQNFPYLSQSSYGSWL